MGIDVTINSILSMVHNNSPLDLILQLFRGLSEFGNIV